MDTLPRNARHASLWDQSLCDHLRGRPVERVSGVADESESVSRPA